MTEEREGYTTGIDWSKLANKHHDDELGIPSVVLGMKDGRFQDVAINGVDIGGLTTDVEVDLSAGNNQYVTVTIKFLAAFSTHEVKDETD